MGRAPAKAVLRARKSPARKPGRKQKPRSRSPEEPGPAVALTKQLDAVPSGERPESEGHRQSRQSCRRRVPGRRGRRRRGGRCRSHARVLPRWHGGAGFPRSAPRAWHDMAGDGAWGRRRAASSGRQLGEFDPCSVKARWDPLGGRPAGSLLPAPLIAPAPRVLSFSPRHHFFARLSHRLASPADQHGSSAPSTHRRSAAERQYRGRGRAYRAVRALAALARARDAHCLAGASGAARSEGCCGWGRALLAAAAELAGASGVLRDAARGAVRRRRGHRMCCRAMVAEAFGAIDALLRAGDAPRMVSGCVGRGPRARCGDRDRRCGAQPPSLPHAVFVRARHTGVGGAAAAGPRCCQVVGGGQKGYARRRPTWEHADLALPAGGTSIRAALGPRKCPNLVCADGHTKRAGGGEDRHRPVCGDQAGQAAAAARRRAAAQQVRC